MENNLVLKRNEVPSELTWDISTVYENVETFENAFKEIEEMLLKHIESDKKIYLVLTIDHPYA